MSVRQHEAGRPAVQRLTLYSKLAFYPIHLEAYRYLCSHYRVQGTIITTRPPDLPAVHRQLGAIDVERGLLDPTLGTVRLMPDGRRSFRAQWLRRTLREVRPDVLWVQEEPTDYFLFRILLAYRWSRAPRIVTAVCENIFPRRSMPVRWIQRSLWGRLDGLLAVASESVRGIRAAGMPSSIAADTLVAGALLPPDHVTPLSLPFEKTGGEFLIGFAGRVCEEKGWKILLAALERLPPAVKCLIAGDGPQIPELHAWMERPSLRGRVFYVGLLPKDRLWQFYRALDCLVVPSLTTRTWKEQFGGVLADAMAVGLPLVGSDSGAIPEVMGPAGLVVPEGDAARLAAVLAELRDDRPLMARLAHEGKERFQREFAIPAYAGKIARMLKLIEAGPPER